jgi:hypothetical protein
MKDVISEEINKIIYTEDVNLLKIIYRTSNITRINFLQDRDYFTEKKESVDISIFQIDTNGEFFISGFLEFFCFRR